MKAQRDLAAWVRIVSGTIFLDLASADVVADQAPEILICLNDCWDIRQLAGRGGEAELRASKLEF
jgi:hypothetical protein